MDVTGAEVQLEIATVGTFSIASGASELKGILTRLKADKKKLAAILTTFTVGNAAELRERYDWAQSSRRQIEQLQAEMCIRDSGNGGNTISVPVSKELQGGSNTVSASWISRRQHWCA